MRRLFISIGFIFLPSVSLVAQDSPPLPSHFLADSLFLNASLLKMPNGAPTSDAFSVERCDRRFLSSDSTDVLTFYTEVCERNPTNNNPLVGRFRVVDMREGKTRRVLMVVAGFSDGHCEVWFNRGFYDKVEPNDIFVYLTEKTCGENKPLFEELIRSFVSRNKP